ncbi:MAG: hypothetical protein M1547_09255 [Gammaproteobacteria bacterium]|nr:hypothetical protein [Gammaproteobacteria bacterium]
MNDLVVHLQEKKLLLRAALTGKALLAAKPATGRGWRISVLTPPATQANALRQSDDQGGHPDGPQWPDSAGRD